MAQTLEELDGVLKRIKRKSDLGRWQSAPAHQLALRLTTMDSPEVVSLEALRNLVGYARDGLGVELELVGGGTGCFDMVLAADLSKADEIERAILEDPQFQLMLNELHVHVARVRISGKITSFAAHHRLKTALITNRAPSGQKDAPPAIAFGDTPARTLSYGVAEFLVLDLSRSQPRSSFAKRLWRKVTLQVGDLSSGLQDSTLERIELLDKDKFQKLLEKAPGKGLLVSVHGYANDFADAMAASARLAHRARLEQLDLLPVIFTWPSPGRPAAYLPDTRRAENSQIPLRNSMTALGNLPMNKAISLLAHSHGCNLLVKAIEGLPKTGEPRFANVILVEADIDATYLGDRVGEILQVGKRMTLYHAGNDRALAIAAALFEASRAGQTGPETGSAEDLPPNVDVIDVSSVATGVTRHSPHLDSIEVIADIRALLQGETPEGRQYLARLSAPNRWRITRA